MLTNGNGSAQTERKYIGYQGQWYDITAFIKHHPGGNVIEKFVGQDATHVIETAHRGDVVTPRKPVNAERTKRTPPPSRYHPTPFGTQMLALHHRLQKEGYYDNSRGWYTGKGLLVIFCNILAFTLLYTYGNYALIQILCSLLLALFWQQSGMLMHDLMHSQVTQKQKIDEFVGVFFGTLCFGISSRWWKDEHIVHHAFTNTVEYASGFADPQAVEDVWVQNEKLFPFRRSRLQQILIKVQYWTFLPLCVLVGRFGIMVDSYRLERRKDVWLAFFLHWIWVSVMLSLLPSWKVRFLFYYAASVGEGILHIQLLMNHYSKPFFEKSNMHETEFFRAMVDANINIITPRWMDWFHGGLNFHIEHHCFPRLPRNRLREVSSMIKKICAENDILYDECSFTCAIQRTLSHMKTVSELYQATQHV